MSQRTYIACRHAINAQHLSPPYSFLDQLIDAINPLPDEIFAENERHDIYSVMKGALGALHKFAPSQSGRVRSFTGAGRVRIRLALERRSRH